MFRLLFHHVTVKIVCKIVTTRQSALFHLSAVIFLSNGGIQIRVTSFLAYAIGVKRAGGKASPTSEKRNVAERFIARRLSVVQLRV